MTISSGPSVAGAPATAGISLAPNFVAALLPRQPVGVAGAATESQGAFLVGASLMFQAIDLADQVSGQDLWRYDYTLAGSGLLANEGISILFDYQNYMMLQSPPPPVSGWNIISLQPDAFLMSAGLFDAQASNNVPILDGTMFSIQFVWKGPGTPEAQPFYFYSSTNFNTPIFSGQTSNVPEPSVAWLGLAGLAAWAAVARARSKTV